MGKLLNNKGYSAIVSVLLATIVGLIIVMSLTSSMISREKLIRNVVGSAQSYYTAEAGLEDMLLRMIDPDLSYDWEYILSLAGATAEIGLGLDDGVYVIESFADKDSFVRGVEVSLVPATEGISFNYGMQVGQGGILMKNDSTIEGSIYSNGNIVGVNSANATGDVWVAGPSGLVDNFNVGGDVRAHTITDTVVDGDAYYAVDSGGNTFNGAEFPGSADPDTVDFPITDDQINSWKAAALAGGTIGTQDIDDMDFSLGPVRINGDLRISGNGDDTFTFDGTVWVTGNLVLENSAGIELNAGYGDNSGVMIVDGDIDLKNNVIICGSEGYNEDIVDCNTPNDSYIMFITTANQLDTSDPAIMMQNNTQLRGILYAPYGLLFIQNSATLKEATAYQMQVENNSTIIYESGLVNLNFTSGPGGGWLIGNWLETIQ